MADNEDQMGFTVDFTFHSGQPVFTGYSLETLVGQKIGAKYRVLAENPNDNNRLYSMKGMEEPMSQNEINSVIEKQHNGGIPANNFAFEVFDSNGKLIYATKFNAKERVPPEGYDPMKWTVTTYSWAFELPSYLKGLLKK